MITELGYELISLNKQLESQTYEIEKYRIKAAKYKALFFGKHELAEKIQTQEEENYDNYIGEFDGFCYSSKRGTAVFRTLEDMVFNKIISKEEYSFCNEKY